MSLVPVVIDKEIDGERSYDIFSRLLKERIIFISGEITDSLANPAETLPPGELM